MRAPCSSTATCRTRPRGSRSGRQRCHRNDSDPHATADRRQRRRLCRRERTHLSTRERDHLVTAQPSHHARANRLKRTRRELVQVTRHNRRRLRRRNARRLHARERRRLRRRQRRHLARRECTHLAAAQTRDFDTYNYMSLGLNINLGKNAVQPLYWLNPLDYAYAELRNPRLMNIPKPVLLDTDGDGVTDQFDREQTPAGCPVDTHGVSLDTDGDGVVDANDRCPNTPSGWEVGVDGCPLDNDKDRVPNSIDECPNTPSGMQVGAKVRTDKANLNAQQHLEGMKIGVDIAKTKDQMRVQQMQSKDVAQEEKPKPKAKQ